MRRDVSIKSHIHDSAVSHITKQARITPQQTKPLFILIASVLLIAALWTFMAFKSTTNVTLDQHVHNIGAQLKCPVCQGESVADSTSERAQEMRAVIRQQILAGRSDQQIIQYFSDRFGTQVVWSPPWWGFSLLAWLVPIILVLGGFVFILLTLRDWKMPLAYAYGGSDASASTILDEDGGEQVELDSMDATELARYREQLERELADEDTLFEPQPRAGKEKEADV